MPRSRITIHPMIAAIQLALIAPATLFMSMVAIRAFQPIEHEPAHSAQTIVMWFSDRRWTLDIFLCALPLLVMLSGAAILLREWRDDAKFRQDSLAGVAAVREHFTTLVIAATTLAAAGILAIVAVHAITD